MILDSYVDAHEKVLKIIYASQDVANAYQDLYLNHFKEEEWEELHTGPQKRLWEALKELSDL